MTITPFKPEHLGQIDLQAEQTLAKKYLQNEEYARSLAEQEAWTLMRDGRVVACAGFTHVWGNRYQAWAVISATIGAAGMLTLSRAVLRAMELKTGRVEAYVAEEFEAGRKWAELMGFSLETPQPMRGWLPEGGGAFLYSRIK